jgi:sugar phosphate isomerase/epimerase
MNAHPRLSLNQATIKYADLAEALDATVAAGYESIGLWREPVQAAGLSRSIRLVEDSGLRVSSLCRGGFFTMEESPARRESIDDNRRAGRRRYSRRLERPARRARTGARRDRGTCG